MSWLGECALIAGLLAACWGWGLPVARLSGLRPGLPFLTAAQGLALLAVLGGWLNLFGLASAPTATGLVLAGLALALAGAAQALRRAPGLGLARALPTDRSAAPGLLFWALPLGLLLFLAAAILPPSALNYHDDFMKYLPRTVRMLQTGSLWGDPFDSLGLDNLGAQDFLNGLAVALRGAAHANALDSALCPVLAILLLRDLAASQGRGAAWAILPACALLVLDPQDVNISALYSGAAFLLGLLHFGLAAAPADTPRPRRELLGPALFLAGLVVLKNTLLAFVLLASVAAAALVLASPGNRQARLRELALLALAALGLALPWLIYPGASLAITGGGAPSGPPLPLLFRGDPALAAANFLTLFSARDCMYGSPYLLYTACALGLAAGGALLALRRDPSPSGSPRLLSAAVLAFSASYFGYPLVMPHDLGMRYHMPMLLALFPAVLLLVQLRALPARAGRAVPLVLLVAMAAAAGPSLPGLAHRLDTMARIGNELAFHRAQDPAYLRYCATALSEQHRDHLRSVQALVPPESRLFCWISTPFALDYRRNPVFSAGDGSGLILPWLGFPVGAELADFRAYLRGMGVDYVLWEKNGYGMIETGIFSQDITQASRFDLHQGRLRAHALASLYLHWVLTQAAAQAQPIFDNGRLVLFRP